MTECALPIRQHGYQHFLYTLTEKKISCTSYKYYTKIFAQKMWYSCIGKKYTFDFMIFFIVYSKLNIKIKSCVFKHITNVVVW